VSVIQFTVHSVLVSDIFYVIPFHLLVPRHCTVSSHAVVPSTCHPADNLKINGDCVRCQPCQRHPQIKHCLSEFGLQCRLHRTVVSHKNYAAPSAFHLYQDRLMRRVFFKEHFQTFVKERRLCHKFSSGANILIEILNFRDSFQSDAFSRPR
jgi:hypothetical protein